MKVDIIDFETDETVGTVNDDGQLETDDDTLAEIAQEMSENGGIDIMVPGGTESATAYGEWTITPDDEGFLRAFFEYLPSPFTAEGSTLNSLPNYRPPDDVIPQVEEEEEEEVEKAIPEDFGAEIYRVLPGDGREDEYEDSPLGVAVDMPESDVYVDWNRSAFEDALEDPHVSIYGSVADLEQATGNKVELVESSEISKSTIELPTVCRLCEGEEDRTRMEGAMVCPVCATESQSEAFEDFDMDEDDYTLCTETEKADSSVTTATAGTGQAVYSPRVDDEDEDDPAEKAAERAVEAMTEAAGVSASVGQEYYSNVNDAKIEVIEEKGEEELVVSDGESEWDETRGSIAYKLLSGEWEEPELAEKMADSALSKFEEMHGGKLPVEKETPQNESDALSSDWGGKGNSLDFEQVDDMLFGMHKRACWWDGDDLTKAPPIWDGDAEVPEFVQEVIRQVIDGNVVYDKFAGYSRQAAERIQRSFEENLTQPQGWSLESLVGDLQEMFPGMDDEKALNIARTESSAILNTAREEAYEEREDSDDYVYYWQGPSDHRITEVCREIKEEVEKRGGAVPRNELKSILRAKAEKYENTREGGTPERVDEWVPHYKCRHTLIRDVKADL